MASQRSSETRGWLIARKHQAAPQVLQHGLNMPLFKRKSEREERAEMVAKLVSEGSDPEDAAGAVNRAFRSAHYYGKPTLKRWDDLAYRKKMFHLYAKSIQEPGEQ